MEEGKESPPLEGELEVEEFDVRDFATAFVQAALEVVAILCGGVFGTNSIAEVVSGDLHSVDVRDLVRVWAEVHRDALDTLAQGTVLDVTSDVEDACLECGIRRSEHEKLLFRP